VQDMQKCGTCKSIECLELTLKARNIAPTACDTLQCFPYRNNDPFIIQQCPHVYFAGNCPDLMLKTIQGSENQRVTLITVPSFHKAGQLLLLDITSMDSQVIQFADG